MSGCRPFAGGRCDETERTQRSRGCRIQRHTVGRWAPYAAQPGERGGVNAGNVEAMPRRRGRGSRAIYLLNERAMALLPIRGFFSGGILQGRLASSVGSPVRRGVLRSLLALACRVPKARATRALRERLDVMTSRATPWPTGAGKPSGIRSSEPLPSCLRGCLPGGSTATTRASTPLPTCRLRISPRGMRSFPATCEGAVGGLLRRGARIEALSGGAP